MKIKSSQLLFCFLSFVFCLLISSCGSLYKVKPPVRTPLPDEAKSSATNTIELRAVPMLTDEESQDLFEANLLLAGILPIRVEFENKSSSTLDLKRAKFRLGDSGKKEWKNLSPKDVVGRILKADGVYAYNPASRKKFFDGLNAHALQLGTPLAQGEKRQGLLFFRTPDKKPVERPQGLNLRAENLGEKLSLQLN